jgi:GntR family transcriptional regulator of arabinose operon
MALKKPRHRQVFETLSREIAAGRYQPGQKFPSEAAVAGRFKVSRITAGRAVHDLQQRGLVERFAGSGTYVKGPLAEPRQELLFGLIIPDLGTTEIFEPICQGIANAPQAPAHALLWPHSDRSRAQHEQQALQLCEQCIARRVSGAFFAPLEMTPHAGDVNRQVIAALTRAGIPVVLLDRRPDDRTATARCDLVSIDNHRAGYLATSHLMKCGARNIGFFAYHGQASSVAGRIAGYRQALESSGHVFHIHHIHHIERLVLPSAAESCDAFVCSNDQLAGRLMQSLFAKGIRVPDEVRIVGIDDVNYASLLPVPLTTIHQPCREIGDTALQLLLDRIAQPRRSARDVLLDCRLVVRESCGCRVTE